MFNQYREMTNYMTYDSSSLNQYNYKNLDDNLPTYQRNENLYYYTRQINPITLSNINAESRDPTNLSSDIRPTFYDGVEGLYGNHSLNDVTQLQTRYNNPNNWGDNISSKPGYYNQNEHTLNNKRPISLIQVGQATSNENYHGYLLF
jgi:hypothetical protein